MAKPTAPSKQPTKIQSMFTSISSSYDFLNHLLSGGTDILWRRLVARDALKDDTRAILDLACGTGDLAIELRRRAHPDAVIIGGDFTHAMVAIAEKKRPADEGMLWIDADGLRLPFQDQSFDLVTIAFGIRNMASLDGALQECLRVLSPGGRLVVLEFSQPENALFRAVYMPYFNHVLPRIGAFISRQPAYRYLAESVNAFPARREFAAIMKRNGFSRVRHRALTFGVAAIHIGTRPAIKASMERAA